MNVTFHPEAQAELLHAIDYYEQSKLGLGGEFAVEVYSTIERIVAHPDVWPTFCEGIRRARTNRFPYGVLYSQTGQTILVLAVMHLHREPNYWKPRAT